VTPRTFAKTLCGHNRGQRHHDNLRELVTPPISGTHWLKHNDVQKHAKRKLTLSTAAKKRAKTTEEDADTDDDDGSKLSDVAPTQHVPTPDELNSSGIEDELGR
jgi:hypothetical protein